MNLNLLIKEGFKFENKFKVDRGNQGEESLVFTKKPMTEEDKAREIKNVAKRYKVDKSSVQYIGSREITA